MSTLLLQINAVVLMLFAAGHTFGFLTFEGPTADARSVNEAMRHVAFFAGGRQSTYFDYYLGFGLSVSGYLLFISYVSWQLGALARARNPSFVNIAWALAGLEAANLLIALTLFSATPAVLSSVVLVLTVIAIWQGARVNGTTKPLV